MTAQVTQYYRNKLNELDVLFSDLLAVNTAKESNIIKNDDIKNMINRINVLKKHFESLDKIEFNCDIITKVLVEVSFWNSRDKDLYICKQMINILTELQTYFLVDMPSDKKSFEKKLVPKEHKYSIDSDIIGKDDTIKNLEIFISNLRNEYDKLKEEHTKLLTDNKKLLTDNEQLLIDNEQLLTDNEQLIEDKKKIIELEEKNKQQLREIKQLIEDNKEIKQLRGKNKLLEEKNKLLEEKIYINTLQLENLELKKQLSKEYPIKLCVNELNCYLTDIEHRTKCHNTSYRTFWCHECYNYTTHDINTTGNKWVCRGIHRKYYS